MLWYLDIKFQKAKFQKHLNSNIVVFVISFTQKKKTQFHTINFYLSTYIRLWIS